jgi:hypothetical protein
MNLANEHAYRDVLGMQSICLLTAMVMEVMEGEERQAAGQARQPHFSSSSSSSAQLLRTAAGALQNLTCDHCANQSLLVQEGGVLLMKRLLARALRNDASYNGAAMVHGEPLLLDMRRLADAGAAEAFGCEI